MYVRCRCKVTGVTCGVQVAWSLSSSLGCADRWVTTATGTLDFESVVTRSAAAAAGLARCFRVGCTGPGLLVELALT